MPDPAPPTKAERPPAERAEARAAARAAAKAAREAQALRANLLKRKEQARATAGKSPACR